MGTINYLYNLLPYVVFAAIPVGLFLFVRRILLLRKISVPSAEQKNPSVRSYDTADIQEEDKNPLNPSSIYEPPHY